SVAVSNFSTLNISGLTSQLNISGTLTLSDSTLSANFGTTNINFGTFGTAGFNNTLNITTLPIITALPQRIRLIDYTTAPPGLVDGGNNLVALSAVLPVA